MTLEQWRIGNSLTYAGLAELIGKDGRTVNAKMAERFCKGRMPRDKGIVRRIFEITDGEVTPNDWYHLAAGAAATAPADGSGAAPATGGK